MPTVADFAQFSDRSRDLRVGGDIDVTFERNISAPVSGEGALLTWNIRREGLGSVTYMVRVNGTEIFNNPQTVNLIDWVSVQEVLDTEIIRQGNNTVEFRVTDGTGTLSFADVVLFYRKNI